jgi:hypothetical protein
MVMGSDVESILDKILNILGYKEDRVAFIQEFMNLCMRGAFVEYMKVLSEDRRNELQQILLEQDPVKVQEQLEPYMTTEEYKKLLQESTQKLFQEYLEKVMPILSEEQKNNLYNYLATLTPTQQPAASNVI